MSIYAQLVCKKIEVTHKNSPGVPTTTSIHRMKNSNDFSVLCNPHSDGHPLFDTLQAIRFVSYSGTNYSELFDCKSELFGFNLADTFNSDICCVSNC